MWTYEQATGTLSDEKGYSVTGYSGHGDGKNNPAMQSVRNIGPIPVGRYTICAPRDTKDHGPFVLSLTPYADNNMCGRAGFLIHGDSISAPGTASHGCIIVPRTAREKVWASGDRILQVI